ncbi:MAG TPA: peptidase S58 family protein [Anaerolineae bacterium]|nr:peptidase S58 family protein [Anaerolineae bacterium]
MNNDTGTITDVPGIQVGHATDEEALTGCTVVLCEAGAVAGVDQRGGAPGTRETDLLHPMHLIEQVHAVLLSGGSAFGLDAATGVMAWLESHAIGFDADVARVPIVPAAVLFDLALGRADVRPGAEMGWAACQSASAGPVGEGNVGVGTGATAGKILGMAQAMKAGLGSAAFHLGNGLVVGALVAANPLGDVINPRTGEILAGVRAPDGSGFAEALVVLRQVTGAVSFGKRVPSHNTVIGVVATNACLTKEQANKVAQMAQDGVARAVCPAHTLYDGDTMFALSTGSIPADVTVVGAFAAEAVAEAIVRGVKAAQAAGGLPAWADLRSEGTG